MEVATPPPLPAPWQHAYDAQGAQVFTHGETGAASYLHPVMLARQQAEGRTGKELVVVMRGHDGDLYGVDYSCLPQGRIVWRGQEGKAEDGR
jgi:hypothetical protein